MNVEHNDNARAGNWEFSPNCGSIAKYLNYLLVDYSPSMELHTVYIIQLYIHITVQGYLPKMFVFYIYGQFRDFPGSFFTIHDFPLILELKTSF